MKVDAASFTPEFLKSLTDLELVMLQHDLRKVPEDRTYLDAVLQEMGRREKKS